MVLKKNPLEHKNISFKKSHIKEGIVLKRVYCLITTYPYSIEQSFTAYSRLLIELKKHLTKIKKKKLKFSFN